MTVAIGAPGYDGYKGHVRLYSYNIRSNEWTRLRTDIVGEAAGDQSGKSVSLSGDGSTVAIGAIYKYNHRGQVLVWTWDGMIQSNQNWTPLGQPLVGEAEGDLSGYSVSLSNDGMTVAIGAIGHNEGKGKVRVWIYDDGDMVEDWVQLGEDINGQAANDHSGKSVSLSGDGKTVAIGAHRNDGNGEHSGHVRVYSYNDIETVKDWGKLGQDINGVAPFAYSGMSVSLSGDGGTVAIGAPGYGNYRGQVQVLTYDDNDWAPLGTDIVGVAEDNLGMSVSLSGDGDGGTVAIGAPFHDDIVNVDSGRVQTFTFEEASESPSVEPSAAPSVEPSESPSILPSVDPSESPSTSTWPSTLPSVDPSESPSVATSTAPKTKAPKLSKKTKRSKSNKAPKLTKAPKTRNIFSHTEKVFF